ncbi:hypothetical protein HK097_004451 [Rhizophlyctis rosea]|uniref:Homeobox domain-containing protein n=1 Tax=Rhizophlyctis rosea TaxID=64517 RepID=A0AAD5X2S1_9FUNG|nr:hypothetical protein HK097_004451 [Rhizophlyctis rosea]
MFTSVSFPPLKTSRFSSSSSYYTEDDTSDSDWSYSIPQRGRSYSVHIAKRQRAYSSPRSTNAKGSRPNHKKWTNDVLESWFFAKWPNSFPSDAEKEKLCSITEINKRQLENWFINARRPDRKRAPMAQAIYERRIPMPVYDHGFTWD